MNEKETTDASADSILSKYVEIADKQNKIRMEIMTLKLEDEEISDEILSFKRKICKYVQEGLSRVPSRFNSFDYSILGALSAFDDSGILKYIKMPSFVVGDKEITDMSMTADCKSFYFETSYKGTIEIKVEAIDKNLEDIDGFVNWIVNGCDRLIATLKDRLNSMSLVCSAEVPDCMKS